VLHRADAGYAAARAAQPPSKTEEDDMADRNKGRCFCGAVEIEAVGEPQEMGYCHCASCRSYTGAPLSAFVLWKAENVRVTQGADLLGSFRKSELSDRRFCMRCGGHVMTCHPTLGFTDVYAGVLQGVDFRPVVHLNYAEAVLRIRDGLPKQKDFPVAVGGSGEITTE
jgi:hypothetical protein